MGLQAISGTFCALGLVGGIVGGYKEDDNNLAISGILEKIGTLSNLGLLAIAKYNLASGPLLIGTVFVSAFVFSQVLTSAERTLHRYGKDGPSGTTVTYVALCLTRIALKIVNIFLAYSTIYKNTNSIAFPRIIGALSVADLTLTYVPRVASAILKLKIKK